MRVGDPKKPLPWLLAGLSQENLPRHRGAKRKKGSGGALSDGSEPAQPHGCGGTSSVGQRGGSTHTRRGVTSLGEWEMSWDAGKEYFVIPQGLLLDVEGKKPWQGKE